MPTVTVTVTALAKLGQKARSGAIITINTAMRTGKIFIGSMSEPHNCKQSVAAGKTAKVTTLLLFSKCYLRNCATDQCTSMAFAGVNRITNMTRGVNKRRIADLSSQPADEDFDQLRIVLVRVFPNMFAQFGAREDAGRFPHQHL